MDERRCSATSKQSGEQCKRLVPPGARVCYIHGGKSKRAQEGARRRLAERRAEALLAEVWDADAPPVEDTLFALKRLAGQLTNAVDVLGGRLTDDLDGATPIVWGKVLRELRQLLIGIEQLGLEAKLVELQAEQAQLVSSAFRAAIAVVGSALLPQHRDAMLRTFLKGIGVDVVRLEAAAPEPAGQVVSGELGE